MNAGNHPSHKRSWANQKERIQNLPSICLLKIDGKQKTLDTPWKINMEPKVMEVCFWWFYLFNLVIFRFQPFIFRGTNEEMASNLDTSWASNLDTAILHTFAAIAAVFTAYIPEEMMPKWWQMNTRDSILLVVLPPHPIWKNVLNWVHLPQGSGVKIPKYFWVATWCDMWVLNPK